MEGRALAAVSKLGDIAPSVAAAYALGFVAGGSSGKTAQVATGMTVGSLQDTAATAALLEAGGIDKTTAAEKSVLFAEAAALIEKEGVAAGTAAKAYFVPGRIEVVGKHTDYAGGRSLLAVRDGLRQRQTVFQINVAIK